MTKVHKVLLAIILAVILGIGWRCGGDPFGESEPPPFMAPTTPTQTRPAPTIPAAIPTIEPSRRVYRVTYYGPGFEGGPLGCGSDIYGLFDSSDPTTVASGDGGPVCGTHLTLCSEADGTLCQGVVVKDACGGCSPDHLDLSRAAWLVLGQPEYVVVVLYDWEEDEPR